MIGNYWWNLLVASSLSVVTFIYLIFNNNPIYSVIRAILVFVISFLLTSVFRWFLTKMAKESVETIPHDVKEQYHEDQNIKDDFSMSSEQAIRAAESVKQMLKEEQ
ncbi:hypothetical protein ACLIA0_02855 [Bacillaceae bacterium W0354]